MHRTIAISTNASWNIVNFRRGLVAALREQGWRVIALSPEDEHSSQFDALDVQHLAVPINSLGISPLADLKLLIAYFELLGQSRPDVFLSFTAKPNIYGSIAAHLRGIPVVNNISGLGTAFIEGGVLQHIVSNLYRIALRRSATVFFQNADDEALFLRSRLVRPEQSRLLPGSGVDLERFRFHVGGRTRETDDPFRFLLLGRLIWQKGIAEYVEAARLVLQKRSDARFQLLGFLDAANRTAVGRAIVEQWATEGLIDYLGSTDDVLPHLLSADCVVLPSYREGLPRALLEAAAVGKPLIATDVPGCRDLVVHGCNGFSCRAKDAVSLADAMLRMLDLSQEQRQTMGASSRHMVEKSFSEKVVISRYLEAIDRAVNWR